MKLIDVYGAAFHFAPMLYDLLKEREEHVNISHRVMPTYDAHLTFMRSHPYEAWYMIESSDDYVGTIYLTGADEIGIFLFERFRGRGHGSEAVRLLMRTHPRGRYLAHINPRNLISAVFFDNLGFKHIQSTYELRS